jgi:hypothetical protein
VSTGIETDATTFSYLTRTEALMPCLSCGGKHSLAEAWLDDGSVGKLKVRSAA